MKMADHDELETLFAQARENRPALPDDLVVRIETDAEAMRLRRSAPKERRQRRWLGLDRFGSWQALGGLVAASAAGVWIGIAAPGFLPDPATYIFPQDTTFLVADLSLDTGFLEDTE